MQFRGCENRTRTNLNLTKRKNFNLCLVKIIGIDVFLNLLQKEGATEIFTLSYGGSVGKEHIFKQSFQDNDFCK